MKRKETAPKITKLLRLLVWENYKCLRRPCVTIFREFHFANRLSLYYILLVGSSFPSWQFILAILRNALNFMHLFESKAKLEVVSHFSQG